MSYTPPQVRQFSNFAVVGGVAACFHYGALVLLVEAAAWRPTPAAVCGYVLGGLISYYLSRAHVFATQRGHAAAGWRFGCVAGVGLGLTYICMKALTEGLNAPYLPAQFLTTGMVMIWSFIAHKFWTFQSH